ncbi:MAG: ribosome maturation factor RimM [Acidobacteriota bacterium]
MSEFATTPTTASEGISPAALVVLAVVRRPWGRRGELLLELETDWPEQRFAPGVQLRFKRRDGREVEAVVDRLRVVSVGPLLALRGIESISAAQPLAGASILASAQSLPRQPDVQLLYSEITGITLVARDGQTLGVVERIDESPAAPLMVVRRPNGAEVLVPLVAGFLGDIDLAARRLTVSLPDGLLDPELAESAGESREDR